MTREEVIEQARAAGLTVEPCAHPNLIGIRAYKPDSDEKMRMGAGGEMYTRGEDGWMYQIGTVEDVARYVETLQ
jgi:hypothetical protein